MARGVCFDFSFHHIPLFCFLPQEKLELFDLADALWNALRYVSRRSFLPARSPHPQLHTASSYPIVQTRAAQGDILALSFNADNLIPSSLKCTNHLAACPGERHEHSARRVFVWLFRDVPPP